MPEAVRPSGAVDALDPPVTLIDLQILGFIGDAGLDEKPVRHGRVVLADDFIGRVGVATALTGAPVMEDSSFVPMDRIPRRVENQMPRVATVTAAATVQEVETADLSGELRIADCSREVGGFGLGPSAALVGACDVGDVVLVDVFIRGLRIGVDDNVAAVEYACGDVVVLDVEGQDAATLEGLAVVYGGIHRVGAVAVVGRPAHEGREDLALVRNDRVEGQRYVFDGRVGVEGAGLAPRMAVITAQKTDRGQFLFPQVSCETTSKGDERAVWRGRDREYDCGIEIVAFPRALRVVEHDGLAPRLPTVRGPAILRPACHAVAPVNLARYVAVEGDDIAIGALGQAVASMTGPTVLLVIDVRNALIGNVRGNYAEAGGRVFA